jgi:hypothetical protein
MGLPVDVTHPYCDPHIILLLLLYFLKKERKKERRKRVDGDLLWV